MFSLVVLDCMLADSNVKFILYVNENFNVVNQCLLALSRPMAFKAKFVAIHPPRMYFAVIIARLSLKSIIVSILISKIDYS